MVDFPASLVHELPKSQAGSQGNCPGGPRSTEPLCLPPCVAPLPLWSSCSRPCAQHRAVLLGEGAPSRGMPALRRPSQIAGIAVIATACCTTNQDCSEIVHSTSEDCCREIGAAPRARLSPSHAAPPSLAPGRCCQVDPSNPLWETQSAAHCPLRRIVGCLWHSTLSKVWSRCIIPLLPFLFSSF